MSMSDIMKFVEKEYKIKIDISSRTTNYVEARAIYYELCRRYLGSKSTELAKSVHRNHATILHALKEFPYMMKYSEGMKLRYYKIRENLDSKYNKLRKISLEELQLRYDNLEYETQSITEELVKLKKYVRNLISEK